MADTIGIKIGIDGEKEFKSAIAAINAQMKTFSSEMYASVDSMTKVSDKETLITNKTDILKKQIETTKQKIEVLSGEYDRQVDYLSELDAALQKTTAEFGENSDEALKAQNAYNKQVTAVEKLQTQLNTAQGDLNSYSYEMDHVKESMENAGKEGSLLGNIIKSEIISEAIISGVKKLADGFIDFAKKGIGLASDLEEVQNVVDVTFGDGAKEIDSFAKSAATSFGLSELQAKQFTGTLGAMFSSMGLGEEDVKKMSISLAGLAADMGSFYNLDPEEAFAKLRAGISGETEPLKQLGINMSQANLEAFALSQGIGKTYSSMSEAEKATLRYNYIMSATANAQGDFARTSDSFANQQKILELNMNNLASTVGAALLPALTQLTSGFNDFLNMLPLIQEQGLTPFFEMLSTGITTYMPQFVQKGTEMIAGFIEQIGLYLPNILTLGYQMVGSLISGIAASLPQVAGSALDTVTNFLNSMTEQLPVIMEEGVKVLEAVINGIIDTIPEMVSRLPEIITAFVNFIASALPQIVESGVRLLGELTAGIINAIPTLVSNLPKIISAIVGGLGSLLGGIVNAGKDIVKGLWKGINDAKDWLLNKIKGWAGNILNGIKGFFGIHSPSTVMRDQVGKNIVLGVAKGIQASTDTAVTAAKKASSAISSAMASSIKGGVTAMSYDVSANLKSPTDMVTKGSLYQATEAAVNGMSINASTAGSDSGDVISININMDGRTLAAVLFDPLKKEVMQRGEGLA